MDTLKQNNLLKDPLYSLGNNDECYTLDYCIYPILEFLNKDKIIWCPFDKEDSNFVKILRENGNKVIFSHKDDGKDFYKWEPKENWDCIISNPPFTNKRLIFERALSFNKPFALIMTNVWLNDSAPKELFYEKDIQLLMFDKRMFFKNGDIINFKTSFSSSYYCYNFLPKQIIMRKLDDSKYLILIKKGDLVKTNRDFIGKIINYPSNDNITLKNDKGIEICVKKEEIVQLIKDNHNE